MTALRDYQGDLYTSARSELAKYRAICIQLATGGGKTAVASEMVSSVLTKNKRAWFITPRVALVDQASKHFRKWAVAHGIINAESNESRAYRIHVVSKDTLIRRWDKIKNWPNLIIIDECHINYKFQLDLFSRAPAYTKFIGFTATPERLDGRGLSVKGGGIYDKLIEGPSIPDLTSRGFLTDLRYFSPPIDGLQNLKRKGFDYDEEQLDELLERRKIYGEVVGHYEKYGKGKGAALGFCRSVKAAYQMAERFKDKGHNFHCLEGKMTTKYRKDMIQALTDGEVEGLTTADLVLYGVDIPRVEYGFSTRPTLSFALLMQMIGRTLRPFTEYNMRYNSKSGLYELNPNNIKYKKETAIWMDHVNMVLEHGIDQGDGYLIPPHYADKINWNFDGITKRKKKKKEINVRVCPYLDFMYCQKPSCIGCPHNPNVNTPDARQDMIVIPADLEEKKKPVPIADRPDAEKKEFQDKIGSAVLEYKNGLEFESVKKLLKIAEECGYPVLWVYYRLTEESRHTVNIPLLAEIARQKQYKNGWIYFQKGKIKLEKKKGVA